MSIDGAASSEAEKAVSGLARRVGFKARCALGSAAILVPFLTGAIPFFVAALVLVILYIALLAFLRRERQMSVCLGVCAFFLFLTATDLLLRGQSKKLFSYYRAHEKYAYSWPELPLLLRYEAGVDETAEETGDLCAMMGDRSAAEKRQVHFATDRLGFRNQGIRSEPYGAILFGDSFGLGVGTTQERTFAGLLGESLPGGVYNGSMVGGPWSEYANWVALEGKIPLKKDAPVVWVIFSGNDLDDPYHSTDIESLLSKPLPTSIIMSLRHWRSGSFTGILLRRLQRRKAGKPPLILKREFSGSTVLFFGTYDEVRKRSLADLKGHRNAAAFQATVRAMAGRVAASGRKLLIAVMPTKEEIYSWLLDSTPVAAELRTPFSEFVRGVAVDQGVAVLDLGPGLFDQAKALAAEGKLLWWRDDSHLNEAGNRGVADQLRAALQREEAPRKNP